MTIQAVGGYKLSVIRIGLHNGLLKIASSPHYKIQMVHLTWQLY